MTSRFTCSRSTARRSQYVRGESVSSQLSKREKVYEEAMVEFWAITDDLVPSMGRRLRESPEEPSSTEQDSTT